MSESNLTDPTIERTGLKGNIEYTQSQKNISQEDGHSEINPNIVNINESQDVSETHQPRVQSSQMYPMLENDSSGLEHRQSIDRRSDA